jgi:hypothetical protein
MIAFPSIFVPSNRNTLGDILCGRTAAPSPRKPRKRSESCSPRKGKGCASEEKEVLKKNASVSQVFGKTLPRKSSKKSVCSKEVESRLESTTGM